MRKSVRGAFNPRTSPSTTATKSRASESVTKSAAITQSMSPQAQFQPATKRDSFTAHQHKVDEVRNQSPLCEDNAMHILSLSQVQRLDEVMNSSVEIHSQVLGYPRLSVCLKTFIKEVRRKLVDEGVELTDVRLSGGTASYVISEDTTCCYNDYDFLFTIKLPPDDSGKGINKVKSATLNALMSFGDAKFNAMSSTGNRTEFQESYIRKLFRVAGSDERSDCWSLISLGKPDFQKGCKSIDIKFVHHMRRAYEFSVDSFQIILDSLLTFYDVTALPLTDSFYPTVMAESATGGFQESWNHLQNKIISTRNPEEIRGGGLLKYCRLLVDGYHAASNIDIAQMEKYMCSRFFIDHMDLSSQRARIVSYINDHFPERSIQRIHYLQILQNVIWNSTICLMNQERASVLQLIEFLIAEVRWDMKAQEEASSSAFSVHQNDIGGEEWVCDGVYYGVNQFPLEVNSSTVLSPLMGYHYTTDYHTLSLAASSGFSSMSPAEEASSSYLLSYTSSECPSPSCEGSSSTSEFVCVTCLSENGGDATPHPSGKCKHSQGVPLLQCCPSSVIA